MKLKVLRLAAFVVATVGLTAWIGAAIVGVDLGPRYTLHATFDDLAGTNEGDDVKLAGVVVGEVTATGVERGRAVVSFEVDDDVELPVDSAVGVRWRNLIGQRYLALEPGVGSELLADGDTVARTADAVDLGALVDQLAPLASAVSPDELNRILTTLLQAFEGNAGTFDALLADLEAMLGALAERDSTIDQLLADYATITDSVASRDAQIETMVANLAAIGETFAANGDLLDRALVDLAGFAGGLDAYLTASADDFGATLEHLAVLTGTAADDVEGLEAILQNLPGLIEGLWPAVNRGEWLRVSVLCVTVVPGPCPVSTVISDPDGGFQIGSTG